MRHRVGPRSLLWGALALALSASLFAPTVGCSGGGSGGGGGAAAVDVELVEAFGGLVFDRPVKLVQHPDDPDRWYVVEQGGPIMTFLASDPQNTLSTAVDLSTTVNLGVTTRGEQGVLGLAFDPDFDATTGGELYIAYTDEDTDQSILARYQSGDGGLTFTPLTVPLLAIAHPNSNHNGGDLAFGIDGDFLFYSMGDGGGTSTNGQDARTLLGTILRLDVRGTPPPGLDYGIPSGNPFAGNPSCASGPGSVPCPEIWAYGFRNPWRFSIDSLTGDLWAGDVGENDREEIDFVVAGRNYGWECREGDLDYAFVPPCGTTPLEPPEVVHDHTEAESITGGYVYRGSDIPSLLGHYVYGDFITGGVWAFDTLSNAPPEDLGLPTHNISAFGQDDDGEIYLVTFSSPSIYRLAPSP
ncbi:MAG: PQQ-dependent sugar dehydrogenase, partial [Myxococcota bacterium]